MGSVVVSEQSGVRYLHFGSDWIQGAMRIARPWALELEYTREMMLPLLLRSDPDWPRYVLVIGLGAGSVSKFLFRHRPTAKQTVVEIDAAVVRAAHQHFRLPEACDNLRIVVDDGADFIVRARKRFDLVLLDGYDAGADTGRLTGLPFLLECKAHLSEDGFFATNLLSRRKTFRSSIGTIEEAFDGRVLVLPPSDAGNVIAVAHVGTEITPRLADLRIDARRLKRDTGLNLLPTLARLESAGVCLDGRLTV
jgi:spermidine synthase